MTAPDPARECPHCGSVACTCETVATTITWPSCGHTSPPTCFRCYCDRGRALAAAEHRADALGEEVTGLKARISRVEQERDWAGFCADHVPTLHRRYASCWACSRHEETAALAVAKDMLYVAQNFIDTYRPRVGPFSEAKAQILLNEEEYAAWMRLTLTFGAPRAKAMLEAMR